MRPKLDAIATLLDQGAADSAVRLLRSAWEPELPPEDRVPLYCMWIRALCETRDFDHARTLAKRAAEEFPREPDVLTALGNVLDVHGELERARDAFEVAVDLDASGVLCRYNLGAVLERLGDEERAEALYREALRLDDSVPSMVEANAALGALLRRSGRIEEAEQVYEAYLEEGPLDVEMLVEHGICLSDLSRLEEAIDRFESALAIQPDHSSAWYNHAVTLHRLGRFDCARAAMVRAHEADSSNPLTLAVLGSWILADRAGDLDEALRLIYRAVDHVIGLDDRGEVGPSYASLVFEEVFETLWNCERKEEAREIARLAGRRDWATPHILDTLNRANHQPTNSTATFRVTVRALVDDETVEAKKSDEPPPNRPPEHWPHDASGFTTELTVVASDEEQARELTVAYLSDVESSAPLSIDVRVLSRMIVADDKPRSPGVVRIDATRNYLRRDLA